MDIRKYFIIEKQTEPPKETKTTLHKVFTDGSSLNNGYKNCVGGIGVFFEDDSPNNIGEKMTFKEDGKVSNNVSELTACLRAILAIKDFKDFNRLNDSILVYTDSKYLIDSITKWSNSWEKNGWMRTDRSGKKKPVKNVEIIKQIKGLTRVYNIHFKHVKAHQSEPKGIDKDTNEYKEWYGNMMADKLANEAAKS
jgi:ribonuclease HI